MIKQGPISKPEPGKALVNFVRPSFFGKAVKVSLWDGDKLVGICYGKQAFQYECDPGKHLFIAWSEYKSPVEAELLPDHAYYIVLRIRMGYGVAESIRFLSINIINSGHRRLNGKRPYPTSRLIVRLLQRWS